ncbi:MAG: alpha/beta fold hydrolase [Polyangiales bacterium]
MTTTTQIRTGDGLCPALVFGEGPRAALLFIDGIGMRPAMHALGERLAAAGYRVLMPDLFYRLGAYTAPDPHALFADAAARGAWFARVTATTDAAALLRDVPHYLDALGAAKVGVTGYCMGGRMAVLAAAHFPDRVAAAAAYHPGGLVTDAPDSPHRQVGAIKASVYVAGARDDASFTAEQRAAFDEALTRAGVDHVVEEYPARHGWVPADTPAHDPAAAERHWQTLLALFARTLG